MLPKSLIFDLPMQQPKGPLALFDSNNYLKEN